MSRIITEAFLDEWWEQFRFIKKEEAIHVIDTLRLQLHPGNPLVTNEMFYKAVLPILHTRRLWGKANRAVKGHVYTCIMDVRVALVEQKLAKVPLPNEIYVF